MSRSIPDSEEYDPVANKWTSKAKFYDNWNIAVGCLAADQENGGIYSLGGFSDDNRSVCDKRQYIGETHHRSQYFGFVLLNTG
jgi:hypothetical protein